MAADQGNDGRRFEPTPFEQLRELLGGNETQAREQGHHVDGKGTEERVTPAPAQEIGLRQIEHEVREQDGSHHEADRRAELRDGGIEAPPLHRCVEGEKGRKPVPGPTEGQALPDPEDAEKVQGPGADRPIAGQERDRHGGEAEQEERDGEFDAAAMPPVDGHEDDRPDRPGDEGQREHGKGVECCRQRIREGKVNLGEDHHGGDGEYEEVEVFRRATDDDSDGDLARSNPVVGRGEAGVTLERRRVSL